MANPNVVSKRAALKHRFYTTFLVHSISIGQYLRTTKNSLKYSTTFVDIFIELDVYMGLLREVETVDSLPLLLKLNLVRQKKKEKSFLMLLYCLLQNKYSLNYVLLSRNFGNLNFFYDRKFWVELKTFWFCIGRFFHCICVYMMDCAQ